MRPIEEKQILDRLKFENPWWVSGTIEDDYDQMPRRLYLDLFKPLVYESEVRRAVVLMGPRRVGKTVMLHHLVKDLIQKKVPPRKIVFITIENPIYNNLSLENLFRYAKKASGLEDKEGWYVIFDEIQYCKDWELHLKSLVDSYRKDKFIVSGSAAATLKLASRESGAGRFTDFLLPPLTFHEYVVFKKLDDLMKAIRVEWNGKPSVFYTSAHLNELNRHFIDYINFGGYPEVIFSQSIQANPERFIRHDIIDKVLLRDLPSLYGIKDPRELNALFTTIAYNSGAEFSLGPLSQKSQVPKATIKRYIEYLEAAYLIKRVRRIDQSGRHFKRDRYFKIYLTNPSLRSALFIPITPMDEMIGSMVETAIFSQWILREGFTPWYARWDRGEVDLVGLNPGTLKPAWALEIKWTNKYFEKPDQLKSLYKFCATNGLNNPIVTTIDREGSRKYKGLDILFFPAASYAYTIGRRTIEHGLHPYHFA